MPTNPTSAAGSRFESTRFESTQWSAVRQAASADPAVARAGLAELCRQYWYPLYAYIRRRTSAAEAEDLTQAFFAHLLTSPIAASADPAQGKFRAYLLACCNHFLSNERARAAALKRGGGSEPVPFDVQSAAQRFGLEPADNATPERLFDRQWALTLLAAALQNLEQEREQRGDGLLFARLKPLLTHTGEAPPHYAAIAGELGLSADAVKKAAQRLRAQYGAILRRLIAATCDGPEQVTEEIRDLFVALRPR